MMAVALVLLLVAILRSPQTFIILAIGAACVLLS